LDKCADLDVKSAQVGQVGLSGVASNHLDFLVVFSGAPLESTGFEVTHALDKIIHFDCVDTSITSFHVLFQLLVGHVALSNDFLNELLHFRSDELALRHTRKLLNKRLVLERVCRVGVQMLLKQRDFFVVKLDTQTLESLLEFVFLEG
jgi:hypothetical protein